MLRARGCLVLWFHDYPRTPNGSSARTELHMTPSLPQDQAPRRWFLPNPSRRYAPADYLGTGWAAENSITVWYAGVKSP